MVATDTTEQKAPAALDQDGYERAYSDGFRSTLRMLRSKGADFETAEELAQAAWARGWQFRQQLLDPLLVGAWVNTIARNLFWSRVAYEQRYQELGEIAQTSNWDSSLEARAILSGCSEGESKLLRLFYLEGYTMHEIARNEKLCATTVRVRMMRLRRKVRTRLESN